LKQSMAIRRNSGDFSSHDWVELGSGRAMAGEVPMEEVRAFIDVGGAQGGVRCRRAQAPAPDGRTLIFTAVRPIFEDYVRSFGLHDRLKFQPGASLKTRFPRPMSSSWATSSRLES
jgi:hypothetical protein